MPGPVPSASRRRRNAPTFPTTRLPVSGYRGPIPKVPKGIVLGDAGRGWWLWAWRTPQAAAWNRGAVGNVARRAQLEDVWAGQIAEGKATAAMAGALMMLDHRLGLTPKGMLELRWELVADIVDKPAAEEGPEEGRPNEVAAAAARRADREKRLGVST